MFCNNCGGQMERSDAFCPHCGALNKAANADIPSQTTQTTGTQSTYVPPQAPPPRPAPAASSNICAIIGLICSLIGFTLPGLICGIIGLNKAKQGAPNKGMAIAAIVISVLVTAFEVLMFVIGFVGGFLGAIGDVYYAVTGALLTIL